LRPTQNELSAQEKRGPVNSERMGKQKGSLKLRFRYPGQPQAPNSALKNYFALHLIFTESRSKDTVSDKEDWQLPLHHEKTGSRAD